MIAEPMVYQPIAIGLKKDEPVLLAKINTALSALDKAGEIDRIWAKWLGPNTEYKMTRDEKVTPLADLKFELLP
jgi:polar amino acid transport system substrate-binding protein